MNSFGAQNGGPLPIGVGQSAAPNDPRLRNVVVSSANSQLDVKSFAFVENNAVICPGNNILNDMPSIYVSQPPPPPSISLPSILLPPPPPPRTSSSSFPDATPHYYTAPATSTWSIPDVSFRQPLPPALSMSQVPYRQPPQSLPEIFDASVPPPPILTKRPVEDFCEAGLRLKLRKIDATLAPEFKCEKCLQRQLRTEQTQKESENLSRQIEYKKLLLKSKTDETENMKAILRCLLPTSVCAAVERNLNESKSKLNLMMDLSSVEDMFARSLINSADRSPSPEHHRNDNTLIPLSIQSTLRSLSGEADAMPALAAVSAPAAAAAAARRASTATATASYPAYRPAGPPPGYGAARTQYPAPAPAPATAPAAVPAPAYYPHHSMYNAYQ